MTNLDASNSSTDSSSGSTSDSSSSATSSTSSSASSSSDSESSTAEQPAAATAAAAPKSPKPVAPVEDKKREEPKPIRSSKPKISSSSDEEQPKPATPKPIPPKRSTKPKNAASVLAKAKSFAPRITTGAKSKAISKTIPKQSKIDANILKKKSIFSPDNSSESESESKHSRGSKTSPKASPRNGKKSSRKSSEEKDTPSSLSPPPTPILNEDSNSNSNSKDNVKRRASRLNGPPPKKVVEDKSASSCTSSQSSIESVSSESDSESIHKNGILKTGKTKSPSNASSKQETTGKSGDSGDSLSGTMPRKLTRSLSARVSRMATASKLTHTDTDSDTEEKCNEISKDDKRLAKARAAIARSPALPLTPTAPSERRCPVRDCDSMGHLGGKAPRHFTWDACPIYHNVTAAWCVAAAEERAAAAATRRRALAAMQQRPRAMPTIEQRAYQLKVKDMRSKWKGSQELRSMPTNEDLGEEREPVLEGFAPDYDLRLFRDAQALAAVKIEEELGEICTDKGTRYVVMGKYMMEVWYQSPYPGDAARVPRLFVCEFCLSHQKCAAGNTRHKAKCVWRHPPGDEVYRKDSLSVWQVDGRKHKQYCQQLCLLAKFFLDHKTLYYDVEPFLFYVMTCADSEGCHIVGYFSKEKNSFLNYNVSCILTLPPYQRQGYGRLLIDFSYLLTKVEGKVGSPETPLSDLGLISYRSYWKEALLKRLCSAPGPMLSIRNLSSDLAIASSDIVSTLQERGLMKYWKGKHIVLKKQEVLEDATRRAGRARCVDPASLRWWGGGGGGAPR
ncbi:histone acetyltransferase KAT7 isoform X2 [Pararge aegeria]|uniref:histone acetyltransferase KAT7 isoform X2 n=1 Tax=Pararge aegeria TaxID=116150 RepID=UPI0019D2CDD2|nr:histone acetyltransferase KAT7 isoform X2 [Pararge aegeria]